MLIQQRIVDNTDERGSIWFATETWALLSLQDCTLMINTQDGLVQISRSDRLHSFICDIVSQYCLKLGNHETIQPFSMRLQTARSSIADSIAALDIGPDTKKALSQLMTSIQPICIIRGHGVLTHGTQSFSLKELNLHYPGCYRTNPWIDWLFSRPHIDLRPELLNPLHNKPCMRPICSLIFRLTQHRLHVKTGGITCTRLTCLVSQASIRLESSTNIDQPGFLRA